MEKLLNSSIDEKIDLVTLLKQNENFLSESYNSTFALQRFISKETGVSRLDISRWKKEGLLPLQFQKELWNRFSLIECVWLRLIRKLKKFGFDNKSILILKEIMFGMKAKDLKKLFEYARESQNIPSNAEAFLNQILDQLATISDEQLEKELANLKYSLFGQLVMACYLFHIKLCILINDEMEVSVVNMGTALNKSQEANVASTLKHFIGGTLLMINLQDLCSSFFDNEYVLPDNDYYFGLMNPEERKVIAEIRNGNCKELTVKFNNGAINHIIISKDKKDEEVIRQVSRLFKKGQYKTVEGIVVDGKVVSYIEHEIIKITE